MRRAIVTTAATVSGLVLLLGLKDHPLTVAGGASGPKAISIGSDGGAAAPDTPATSGGSARSTTPTKPTTNATQSGGSATKVITGSSIGTRYGPVQLRVTFSGSKITKIDVIQYPTESNRDQEINDQALPILNQEAMAKQSANIDVVSGASYTSNGYAQSLQSAIDQVKA